MQAQEDERDVQSPSRDIPLIPRKRFTGFDETLGLRGPAWRPRDSSRA